MPKTVRVLSPTYVSTAQFVAANPAAPVAAPVARLPSGRLVPDGADTERTLPNTGSGAVFDVGLTDAGQLAGQGWKKCWYSGPTSDRPRPGMATGDASGSVDVYVDATLNKVIVWDGFCWRDPITGAVV